MQGERGQPATPRLRGGGAPSTPPISLFAYILHRTHALVHGARGRRDRLGLERQHPKALLHQQPEEPLCVENKVVARRRPVANHGMHHLGKRSASSGPRFTADA